MVADRKVNTEEALSRSMQARAVTEIHEVIAEAVIRLGVGRREYRAVVAPSYDKIRKAIKWKDGPRVEFCPQWQKMKSIVARELKKGPNRYLHRCQPDWREGAHGAVWSQVDKYIAERLVAFREQLPDMYREHLKTLIARVQLVKTKIPDLNAAIRVPLDLQNGEKLVLIVHADGALIYKRQKMKVALQSKIEE